MKYDCEHCGCCCRHLDMNKIYASLDRGDGICRYLNGNDCTIYDNRPLYCQIDKCYEYMFSSILSRKEFYKMNKKVCKILQRMEE